MEPRQEKTGPHLAVFEPGEAVRAEDEPVLPRGALDERDRDAQPALPDELVPRSPGPALPVGLGGAVKPDEVWVVGVHVGQLNLDHQLQLHGGKERRGGERRGGGEGGMTVRRVADCRDSRAPCSVAPALGGEWRESALSRPSASGTWPAEGRTVRTL